MSVDATTVRRIAHLARIAVKEDDVAHLQGELNAILDFVEQLSEVNVDGVAPMTSVTPMALKQREDKVTDGDHRRCHRRQRARDRRSLLPRAEGGRVMCNMCDDESSYRAYMAYMDFIEAEEAAGREPDMEKAMAIAVAAMEALDAERHKSAFPKPDILDLSSVSILLRTGSKMTDVSGLTLASARDGLAKKSFSSLELTDAFLKAMEAARVLNAYVLETPDKAREMAKASGRDARQGEGGPLEGLPIGVKDLFATRACAHRLLEDPRQPLPLRAAL